MLADQEDVYYYITLMNENYPHPGDAGRCSATESCGACTSCATAAKPQRRTARAALRLGRDPARSAGRRRSARKAIGTSQRRLERTSFNELQRDGVAAQRWNLLHPDRNAAPLVRRASLGDRRAARVAATDYMQTFAEQIRPFVGRRFVTLGTDGYGRSDYRRKLREFFEVDRHFVALAALKALADDGTFRGDRRARRSRNIDIDPEQTQSGHGVEQLQ